MKLLQFLFDASLYLPDVQRELHLLPTQQERNAARLYVWRRLFRSSQYWLLCVAMCCVAVVALGAGRPLLDWAQRALSIRELWVEALLFLTYGLVIAAALSYFGMWPLRRLVARTLRDHLAMKGLRLCTSCGYDLRGMGDAPRGRCPECGATE